ncbi:hypothetical protein NIES4072_32310 [Nostoc commune NIES-4072]|uniref:Uncharacterized protein n=1 Tax=Nostoc commune NIES-4072 TaxID=2005467 RepID=A0A2R5FTM5_NOSCO|nr:hypothetical protein [Nostoc commune]BBD69436.1 hypothetical protein NIES4070_58450 [Nostoc commune HK-02]GBG19563.1 hypothetical protein NIES4072_32310 [Nostoc commune NIES-4072]
MITTQPSIATTSSPVITVTLESVGVFTGILVSISVLGTLAIKLVNNLNNISTSIAQIKEDLKEHADNAEKIRDLNHKLDLHIQDYINRKDTITLLIAQVTQTVEHRTNRLYTSMKDIENFLQTQGTFKIRDFQDLRKMEEEDPFNKV